MRVEFQLYNSFNYDSEGRRDPFEPYRELELEIKKDEAEGVKNIGPRVSFGSVECG